MQLLAPEVVPSISVCSSRVEVRGNIAGATIDILVNGAVASTHTAENPDAVYSIGVTLTANQKVTARQTFGGSTSPQSLPVTVQDAPGQLNALTFETHPHSCGRGLYATGALPGAKVDALIGNQVVGSTDATGGIVKMQYNPTLAAGQTLVLKQTSCNGVTSTQTSPAAANPPSPLPAPGIGAPLIECQNGIVISGVVDGAYVELYRNNVLDSRFVFGVSKELAWIKPLVANQVITVRQGFACKQPAPPLETMSPYTTATVQSVASLPAPVFVSQPCPGSTSVTLNNLIPGARVVLLQNGAELGETDAPSPLYTFSVPPLQSGATLAAYMELCNGKKGPQATTTVGAKSKSPDNLSISNPYACAAYVFVEISGTTGSYLLYITNKNGQQISPYHELNGRHALIPVSPALAAGDQITVNLLSCGGSWKKYGPFNVLTGPPQPMLAQPVQAGYTYCYVENSAAGAILDVYVNNAWAGSAISRGNLLPQTMVPLSVTLQVGQQVYCTQTLCGMPGKPTPPSSVTQQTPDRPILVAPPNGASDVLTQPEFQWHDPGAGTLKQADSFQLVVTENGNVVINVPTTATSLVSPTVLPQGQAFQWTVTSSNSGGHASALSPFSFTTQPPPQAVLKFVTNTPAITSNLQDGSFPRDESFNISAAVVNLGNATSPPYSVEAQERTTDDQSDLTPTATDPMPALAPGATAKAPFSIVITDPDSIRIDAWLIINGSTVDTAFRDV